MHIFASEVEKQVFSYLVELSETRNIKNGNRFLNRTKRIFGYWGICKSELHSYLINTRAVQVKYVRRKTTFNLARICLVLFKKCATWEHLSKYFPSTLSIQVGGICISLNWHFQFAEEKHLTTWRFQVKIVSVPGYIRLATDLLIWFESDPVSGFIWLLNSNRCACFTKTGTDSRLSFWLILKENKPTLGYCLIRIFSWKFFQIETLKLNLKNSVLD